MSFFSFIAWVARLTWVRLPKLRFIFEPWENTETLCDMGGTFSYSLSPHISQASLQYTSAMTWAFHFSAMFSSVIKAKNLHLYKKLQNLLSMFQKLKSSGFKFERFGGEKTQSSRFVFDQFFEKFCKTRYTRRATPGHQRSQTFHNAESRSVYSFLRRR